MSDSVTAGKSGTFRIGGDIEVNRLGFGTMRLTGRGIWGEPADPPEALRTLKELPALGVNLIDTADAYGPDVAEPLLRAALHPYEGMCIATKGGFTRTGPDRWVALGRAEYLIQQAEKSRRFLGVKQIALWQLHRVDPKISHTEQFGTIKALQEAGIIRHAGLSEVPVSVIESASKFFNVVTVQNRYNLTDRENEDVLNYCERHGIGFIPWSPLGAGALTRPGSLLEKVARQHHASPGQIAIAWLLKRSPVMLPIPGTSKVAHVKENVAAASIELSDEEFAALDREGKAQSTAS